MALQKSDLDSSLWASCDAPRGIEADFGPEHADTFRCDIYPDLRADYALANPSFTDSVWFRQDDLRWQFGGRLLGMCFNN